MKYGTGKYVYELQSDWARLPAGWDLKWIAGVGVDSKDKVYVFNRGDRPMIVFDPDGKVLEVWSKDFINFAHAVYVDGDDNLWLTDRYAQTVWKCTTEGKLLQTLGTVNTPGTNGGPFHDPTQVALGPNGDVFVSDGYKNKRVHRFDSAGKLLRSWGMQGTGPGQFVLPHSVWVDARNRVWIADRENNRIQFFNLDGMYLYEWSGYKRPADFYMDADGVMYVAELDAGIAVVDMDGKFLSRFGENGNGPGQFRAPHGLWGDSRGNLYLCEVQRDNSIHKFHRV